jgi:hypothetical protein
LGTLTTPYLPTIDTSDADADDNDILQHHYCVRVAPQRSLVANSEIFCWEETRLSWYGMKVRVVCCIRP